MISRADDELPDGGRTAEARCPDRRLSELGILLPTDMPARAVYVPYRIHDHTLYISGQGPAENAGGPAVGRLGADVSLAEGRLAARAAAISLIAQARIACQGDFGRIACWLKLTGFVNATPGFNEHPLVVDGATELLFEIFGEPGLPARSAVGVSSLPFGIPVELEAIIALKG